MWTAKEFKFKFAQYTFVHIQLRMFQAMKLHY